MNKLKEPFQIDIKVAEAETTRLTIHHESETFDFEWGQEKISLINNGDNSWSLVSGIINQEEVNLIGTEIEKYYQHLKS